MELREVLSALRASWWLPIAGLLCGGLAGLAISAQMTPQYTANTQLFISTSGSIDILTGSQFAQQRVASYARVLTGAGVASRVIDDLDLDVSPTELAGAITATAVQDTVVLDVTVTDPSPERARDIAQAVGPALADVVSDLETPAGADGPPVLITVIERPQLPTAPSEPRTVRNVGLAAVVGLLLGAAAAGVRHRSDRSVRDPEAVAALVGAPVIGTVSRDKNLARGRVLERSSATRTAEEFRRLQTNLRHLDVDEPAHVILVSSALASEGRTTVAINLSLALAQAGHRVTLVEGDLRHPTIGNHLGLEGERGLTDVLSGDAEPDEVTRAHGAHGMSVLPSGPPPPDPGELLASRRMTEVLDKLRGGNDFVIVDGPALLPVADASGLAASVDGVLLVVRYGRTREDQLDQSTVVLERVRATTLGVILNDVPPRASIAPASGHHPQAGRHSRAGS